MATVEFRYDPKNTAWFTANAAMVLKAGEPAYHDTTGLFKLGDGVTALSALSFLPIVSSSTPTLQQVLTAGQVATTTIETTGFVKTGGTFGEFLKADGSVDNNYYLTFSDISASTPLNYSNLTGVFSMNQSNALSDGYLSLTDWSTFNGKQDTISLTTNNSSGAATLISNVLNVPNYNLAGLGGTTLAAVNAQNLSVFAATTSSQLAGVISDETGSGALVFGTSPTFTTNITTPQITGVSGTLTLESTSNATKGVIQIGTTDLVNIGNAATTNQRVLRIGQNTASIDIGSLVGTTSNGAIYINQLTPSATNYALAQTAANEISLNASSVLRLRANNTIAATVTVAGVAINASGGLSISNNSNDVKILFGRTGSDTFSIQHDVQGLYFYDNTTSTSLLRFFNTGATAFSTFAATSGAITSYTFTNVANTNQTATTNIPNFRINGANKQWATGTVANQYWNYLTANTAAFVGASTMTNSYGLFVEAATAGTNATITNNFALGLAGSLKINDTFNIVFDTTTGTKIATATTQKLSFWNATPIVQPTTAVAAATVVSGTGSNVKHDDTFDGYTLEKIVKALRNIGLLA